MAYQTFSPPYVLEFTAFAYESFSDIRAGSILPEIFPVCPKLYRHLAFFNPLVVFTLILFAVKFIDKIEEIKKRKTCIRRPSAVINIQDKRLRVNAVVTTNITRLLDAKKIPYTIFELPAEKLGAVDTSQLLDVPLEQVFKTIVVRREAKGKPILAVVPGTAEVDLKLLARALGEKKLHLPTEHEAEQLTGLQAGGISPLALINKGFQVVIDSSAQGFREIHISGGRRGLNIRLPVEALTILTNARVESISTHPSSHNF
jgi:Cys-tRNA(Pro)/Cys-tRNA(Cys) deacylase